MACVLLLIVCCSYFLLKYPCPERCVLPNETAL